MDVFMDRRVGIITTHYAANYGAVLQAYALQKAVEMLGYDCEIIDFCPELDVYGRKYIQKDTNIKIMYGNLLRMLHFWHLPRFRSRIYKIDSFINWNMKKSKCTYKSYEELIGNLPDYDCYLCGSDQIWNTKLMFSPAFFLRFEKLAPEALYVAYAPSFPELGTFEDESLLLKNTAHFDCLSARELTGAEFLAQKTGRIVENVLDPVFLLPEAYWTELSSQSIFNSGNNGERYVLLYFIGASETGKFLAELLSRKLGLKVVNICLNYRDDMNADEVVWDASPSDFVALINNADFVCTNSFHAMAFSIIFEKDFLVVANKVRNSRMVNVLGKAGLENRLICSANRNEIEQVLDRVRFRKERDWVSQLNVQKSIDFLSNSLGGLKGER